MSDIDYSEGQSCTDYGMGHGCDSGCPVLHRGECHNFVDVLTVIGDLNPESYFDLCMIYAKKECLRELTIEDLLHELGKRIKSENTSVKAASTKELIAELEKRAQANNTQYALSFTTINKQKPKRNLELD